MRRFVIVGNATPTTDLTPLIDSADLVLRFNRAYNCESGMVGRKSTFWCVCAHGYPVLDFVKPAGMRMVPMARQVEELWFGSPADIVIPDTERIRAEPQRILDTYRWERSGKPWYQVTEQTYKGLRLEIKAAHLRATGKELGPFVPSTGLVGVHWVLTWDRFKDSIFELCGFNFFEGKSAIHPVVAEKAYIREKIESTSLRWLEGAKPE